MPPDDKTTTFGDYSDPGGKHSPAFGDREHLGQCVRRDDREHPFLGLTRQDLVRHHRGLPQRDEVEVDRHPTGATGGQAGSGRLGQRTGQPRAAEVLDGDDKPAVKQLQAGLDENLLGERVSDLYRWSARRSATLVEGRRRQHRHPTDAVPTGLRTEQDDRVTDSGRRRSLHPSDRHHPHAQGVDQRVPQIRRIEDDFPADRRQAQAVAVAADARDHPGQHPRRVGRVGVAEPERVEDCDRPGTHSQDVADNPADASRRTLVGLDETRMIMRFDLKCDGQTLTDSDHPGVLAHADEHALTGGYVVEPPQMHLGRLIRTVFAPHHRVHGKLGIGRQPTEGGDDPGVLVVGETEFPVGLDGVGPGGVGPASVGRGRGSGYGRCAGHVIHLPGRFVLDNPTTTIPPRRSHRSDPTAVIQPAVRSGRKAPDLPRHR